MWTQNNTLHRLSIILELSLECQWNGASGLPLNFKSYIGSLINKPDLWGCDSFNMAQRALSTVYLNLSFKTRLWTTNYFSGLQYWTFLAVPLPILLPRTGKQDFGQVGLFQKAMLFVSTLKFCSHFSHDAVHTCACSQW